MLPLAQQVASRTPDLHLSCKTVPASESVAVCCRQEHQTSALCQESDIRIPPRSQVHGSGDHTWRGLLRHDRLDMFLLDICCMFPSRLMVRTCSARSS